MKKEKYITKKKNRKGEYYEIQVPTNEYYSTNRRKMAIATAQTLDDAIMKRNNLENSIKQDRYKNTFDSQMPFSTFIEEWYEKFKQKSLSENTASVQSIYVKKYIVPHFKNVTLKNLSSLKLQTYFDNLSAYGRIHPKKVYNDGELSINSTLCKEAVKKIRSLILNSLKYAEEEDLINNNPAKRTIIPKEMKKPISRNAIFSNEEIKIFLDNIKDYPVYYPLFTLLFESGLRRSEILGLRWANVNFEDSIIFIEDSLVIDANNKVIEKNVLKNKPSFRSICISDKMVSLLKNLKLYQKENDLTFNNSKNVFRKPQKMRIHPSALYSFFKRKLKKLNLPHKLKIHSIRHTVATILIENNVPISDIQAFGGWSTPRVLLDTYVHANNKNQKNLIASLSKLTS